MLIGETGSVSFAQSVFFSQGGETDWGTIVDERCRPNWRTKDHRRPLSAPEGGPPTLVLGEFSSSVPGPGYATLGGQTELNSCYFCSLSIPVPATLLF